MSSSYPPYYAYPSAPPLHRALPKPPRLHWGWVFALTLVTLGLFANVWLLVQATWVRRMRAGKSTAFWCALANVVWIPLVLVVAVGVGVLEALAPSATTTAFASGLGPAVRLGSIALYLATAFALRGELQAEPIGIPLGTGGTLLFAVFYFQYHIADYGKSEETSSLLGSNSSPAQAAEPIHYPTAAEVGVVMPPSTHSGTQGSTEQSF